MNLDLITNEELDHRRTNFKRFVEQIIRGYETCPAKGLVHGFQKDIIQNGWGHRKSKSGKGWSFSIKYLNNNRGEFLIIEDNGCTGLIGGNYSQQEIEDMAEKKGEIPSNEKLARFSSLLNSGSNSEAGSAGLYGRGKIMYQAVSKSLTYYYDSLTEEDNYVANYVDSKQTMLKHSKEGDNAKEFIYNATGLQPKMTYGTRIIISDPKEEIVEAIKSGLILDYINETWWLIFKKYEARIEVYYENEMIGTGQIPEFYLKYLNNSARYKEFPSYTVANGFKVKRLGLFYADEKETIPEGLGNICYYRNDMKIGEIFEISDLPIDEKYKERLCGFIEFDYEWERLLESNENLEHYGASNKGRSEFQNIKRTLREKIEEFSILMGIKEKTKIKDANEKIKQLANDFTDFLHDCNFKFDWGSSIDKKSRSPLLVEIKKYYPNEGFRTLEYSQVMKFAYSIRNESMFKDFKVTIKISAPDGSERIYIEENIKLASGDYLSDNIIVPFDQFYKDKRNLVTVSVISTEKNTVRDDSHFPVFVNIDEEQEQNDFEFKIANFEFPRENDRSIKFRESITNIILNITNNTNTDGVFAVSCFTQDIKDRNNTIEEIYRNNEVEIRSGQCIDLKINDILFGPNYINRKGPIKVKFKLSHISGISSKAKGETLSELGVTILYETDQIDERLNLFNVGTAKYDDRYLKSQLVPKGDESYDFNFNDNYVLFKDITQDEDSLLFHMFTLEELFKAIVKIKLRNYDYSIIGKDQGNVHDLSPEELNTLINKVTDKYVGQYFEMRK